MLADSPKAIFLKDYQSPDFSVESVELEFDLSDNETRVKSHLRLQKLNPHVNECVLDGVDLELLSVELDGVSAEHEVLEQGLVVKNAPDGVFSLCISVRIHPEANKSFMGLYQSRNNFCTQCEAEGFRKITYFFDRPDVMTRFKTTIRADKTKFPYLLSNGNCIQRKDLNDGRHEVQWEDPSLKPCYLFALVAGDFDFISDTFVTVSGRSVALEFYLEKGFGEQGHFAMESLKRAMAWDEAKYGREYDLDIYMVVAVSDFNMGAMENKGLNVFNTKYVLADPKTATDTDYVGIEDVIGHEYFHNWTGNRITCRDWFQLTLKEGLTVFRDQTFSEDMTAPAVSRIDEVNVVRLGQFPEDAGPLAHPIRPSSYVEINNFYTATVYRKGAEVIRMIQTLVTPQGFRKGMDLYFQRHDGQAVTTDDFVAAMSDANNKDLTQFKRWYDQAGTPVLHITGQYDGSACSYTVKIEQSCPATPEQDKKLPFHMPFKLGFIDQQGQEMVCKLVGESVSFSGMLELREACEEFVFEGVESVPTVSLNRGFSAPVKIKFDYTLDELARLAAYDGDPIARWDAQQMLSIRLISDLAKQISQGQEGDLNPLLCQLFHTILEDNKTDKNLLARILQLPALSYLQQQCPDIDVMALHQAKERYIRFCAVELKPQWLSAFLSQSPSGKYEYNVQQMGRRAFKNTCLFYVVHSGDAAANRAGSNFQKRIT